MENKIFEDPNNSKQLLKVHIGWTCEGAVALWKQRVKNVETYFMDKFPNFTWKFEFYSNPPTIFEYDCSQIEVIEKLYHIKNKRHWDLVFGIGRGAVRKSQSLVYASSILDVGCISQNMLERRNVDKDDSFAQQLIVLLIAHLSGVNVQDKKLRASMHLSKREIMAMEQCLFEIADPRVEEEMGQGTKLRKWVLILRSLWRGKIEIVSTAWKGRPWQLFISLPKMTAANFSALAILLLTGEAWDLGMSLGLNNSIFLATLSIFGPMTYLITRHKLFFYRSNARMTEQQITTQTSALLLVISGFLFNYFILCLIVNFLAYFIYPSSLIMNWTPTLGQYPSNIHYFTMSIFIAGASLAIGALGAAFESRSDFQKILLVDFEM